MNAEAPIIPPAQLETLLAEVAQMYGAPLAECVIYSAERERHRDTCDVITVNGACAACDNDMHFDVVTVAYPGRDRGVYDGPTTRTWHSTWGRKVGGALEAEGRFELYAD